jgi:predicted ATP-grasp superfamily ATP-dependent carboligase
MSIENAIDRKFFIIADHVTKHTSHTERDAVLFLAKDKALPDTLRYYHEKCTKLGADPRHLQSIVLLLDRVEAYQAAYPDLCKEIGRAHV